MSLFARLEEAGIRHDRGKSVKVERCDGVWRRKCLIKMRDLPCLQFEAAYRDIRTSYFLSMDGLRALNPQHSASWARPVLHVHDSRHGPGALYYTRNREGWNRDRYQVLMLAIIPREYAKRSWASATARYRCTCPTRYLFRLYAPVFICTMYPPFCHHAWG